MAEERARGQGKRRKVGNKFKAESLDCCLTLLSQFLILFYGLQHLEKS